MNRMPHLQSTIVILVVLLVACGCGAPASTPPPEAAGPATGASRPTEPPAAADPSALEPAPSATESAEETGEGSTDKSEGGAAGQAGSDSTALTDWGAIVRAELARLPVGRILFNPPADMKMGRTERVEVRVAQDQATDLTEGLRGRGAPEIEPIKVSTFMKARLTGDSFEITPLNEAEQLVAGDTFTEWAWDVTPLRGGDQKLNLIVTVRLQLPSVGEETRDYPVIDRAIHVQVDPVFSAKRFVGANWQWLISVLAIPIAGWAIKEIVDRRKSARKGGEGGP